MGRIALSSIVVVVSYFVPDLLMKSKGQERQTKIGLELPDTLDQITIAVEAGLGFEAAMMRAAKNGLS
jgi:tight adherence protein C